MQGLALALLLSAASPVASTPAAGAATARVRELVVRSIREYNSGDFERALKDATEAYQLTGLPSLLFNLGQCQRALGNWKQAEFFYKGYLRENPAAKNRAEVLALLAEAHAKAAGAEAVAGTAGGRAEPAPVVLVLPPGAPATVPAPPIARPAPRVAAPATLAAAEPDAPRRAAPPGAVSATLRPRRTGPLTYIGAALLAGAAGAGYYAVYGLRGAATAVADRNAAPLSNRAGYAQNIGGLQTLGVGALVGGVALAVGGALLVAIDQARR